MITIFIAIFIFGLVIGSFLNVVIYRLKAGGSIVKGRSHCPRCKKTLQLPDLIPLFSFIIQKGKCRYCQQKISWKYPLVELFTAIAFLLVFLTYQATDFFSGDSSLSSVFNLNLRTIPDSTLLIFSASSWLLFIGYFVFTAFLIVIFTYDLKHYLISDKVIIPGVILAFLFSFISPRVNWIEALIGAIMVSGFFALIIFLTRGKGMGWGDAKLGLFIGALLGWQVSLSMLFIAFVSGSLVGIALILFKQKKWKSQVPFGTFLTVSTFICMLWGQKIVEWYLGMINLY